MKIWNTVTSGEWQVTRAGRTENLVTRHPSLVTRRAFTMIEIAISLAIIGIALLGIIGVLPIGLHTQRDNREQTIINQDATVLLEAITSGARGMDDLTNYVYAITNYWYFTNAQTQATSTNADGYDFTSSQITKISSPPFFPITNGLRIVGLLSTPEFTDSAFNPTNNLFNGGYSNRVVAYVRSLSGPAVEKPPQDNSIMVGDSFTYRVVSVNAPVAMDPNNVNRQLAANLHELRLTFQWPQRPNGSLGGGRQTFRATIAGQVTQTNDNSPFPDLYFYQSQSFTNAP